MKKIQKIQALLAVTISSLMLGCSVSSNAQTFSENPRFLRYTGPVLGLNERELRKALGNPGDIAVEGCVAPYKKTPSSPVVPIVGDSWFYTNETDTVISSMVICVVKEHAIAFLREARGFDGNRVFRTSQEVTDLDLVGKVFKGELDESSSYKDRTVPKYNGPEHEI